MNKERNTHGIDWGNASWYKKCCGLSWCFHNKYKTEITETWKLWNILVKTEFTELHLFFGLIFAFEPFAPNISASKQKQSCHNYRVDYLNPHIKCFMCLRKEGWLLYVNSGWVHPLRLWWEAWGCTQPCQPVWGKWGVRVETQGLSRCQCLPDRRAALEVKSSLQKTPWG